MHKTITREPLTVLKSSIQKIHRKFSRTTTKPPELLPITALSETNSAQTAIGHATAAIARLLTALAC
ncbi:hypothetical protein A3753_31020 [Sulfitobacter sp. HI0082]|nr:hypothetical protein A3753_31020 [Sulfitobacter sp. HI0082]